MIIRTTALTIIAFGAAYIVEYVTTIMNSITAILQ